ncbi:MAG TPA: clostripain [Clostridiales bacterium]|nr:clostripain [Clostridiales bacterium]
MMKKSAKKWKVTALLLAMLLLLSTTGCGADDTALSDNEWAIYFYLCGSDLETNGGAATNDLAELLEVQLPENVKIIIQTGGASQWQNELISSEFTERYVFDSNGLSLVEQLPQANMGDENTLSEFLAFAKENYPAEKTGFIFWNHGGGSIGGAAYDENFGGDSLKLDEMYNAFYANYELAEGNQPFEFIGFDTCLMATVDVAYTFSDVAKYLVASQELEPGNGWYYTGWAGALAQDPGMDGLALGTIICDTYQEGCEAVGTADEITLSVTNLTRYYEFLGAYNEFGKEALANACEDPDFISSFGRIAMATENYGGNTKEQGYTNMVDLGHLARQASDMLPGTSGAVLSALDDCIEYQISGPYRQEATGLSCYFSLNGDIEDYNGYANLGAGEAFKYYYALGLTGDLSEEGMAYISEMDYDSVPQIQTLETQGWEDHPLDVDEYGSAILTLGDTADDILTGMYIQLYYVDPEQDFMLLLGSDNDLIADWENGIFKDNFRGVWGGLDGCLVYMEIAFEGDDYNLYSVPILLNGEEYNLNVIYDFGKEAYEIQGARKPIDENGMADKNLRYLVEGDIITTIHYGSAISSESDELLPVEVDTITVTPETSFAEIELGDGLFLQIFEMRDMQGNVAYSDVVTFETINGEITTYVGY